MIIVISDLHIGAGLLDDCDNELENNLVEFLNQLGHRPTPVELVINGDFLDFAQAPPWRGSSLESIAPDESPLCFTEEQSLSKLESIIQAHKPIFDAISTFLATKTLNRLVVIPGNHDADFFWSTVRCALAAALGPAVRQRLMFHMERAYRPSAFPRVWIEHGHQSDPLNCFYSHKAEIWSSNAPPIMEDILGRRRLYECIGTRFLIRFLNYLDAEYPFVDNVKPFSRFIRLFAVSALKPGFGPLKVTIAMWRLMQFVTESIVIRPTDLLGLQEDSVIASLLNTYKQAPASRQRALAEAVRHHGFNLDRPLEMYVADKKRADSLLNFLADNPALLESLDEEERGFLSLGEDAGTLSLARGFAVDESGELKKRAKELLRRDDVGAVVMGHTHEAVNSSDYINAGSWTRYYTFVSGQEPSSWSLLKVDSYANFPYSLKYVEISGDAPDCLRLVTFKERSHG
jgi:UDP-2,3-diacylglucosamine pyrophosphatase LpxH